MLKERSAIRVTWFWWAALLILVTLLWCHAYNRWTREAWATPVHYTGDTLGEMAAAKALATGEIHPIVTKYPSSLGAPFVANWNDYPSAEEGVFTWYAILVRLLGVFTGSNVTLLSAHLLAAASFYFVGRVLGYHRIWSFAGALLFSMSHYAFARSLWHLSLTFYWHVPLGLLVVWWCLTGPAPLTARRLWFCIAVSVLHGIQYAYYTGMFLQFLFGAAIVCLVRRNGWRLLLLPLLLAAVVIATVVVMNADTLYYRLAYGPNAGVLIRDYPALEIYALKPVELFVPSMHRFHSLQTWANQAYYSQTMFHGENDSSYLGMIGIAALGWLVWEVFRALVSRAPRNVPIHSWGVGWILAFSIVGGLNGIIGLFGIVLFRGSNRYSIVILALLLLFLVRELTRLTRGWHWTPVSVSASLIVLLGLWDQIPPPPTRQKIHRIHEQVVSDGRLVSMMESRLPARAIVFQLPVHDYPEVGPIGEMGDYEHFRPYLQSRSLRFSYGSHKGRTRERWQAEAMQFGPAMFVTTLENYGFSAVLINKKAYEDRAASLLLDLRAAGRSEALVETADLISVLLHPVEHPVLPPEFDEKNWELPEGGATEHWRWSTGNARIILHNAASNAKMVHLTFSLGSMKPRFVEIYAGSEKVYGSSLDPTRPPDPVALTLSLKPGPTELNFRTDRTAELPGNGDSRKLAFNLRNFTISE